MSITIIFSSDKNSFKKHISYLSSDDLKGRYPGTIGDSLASDYIYNFNSTINTKTYNQYFDYLSFINRTGKISFITDSTTKEYKIGIDFITDLKSSSKKLQAEIVFVGFGRTENGYNDFKNIDIKNKIVFYFISPLPSFSKEKKKIWAKGFSKKKFYEKIYRDGALGIIYIAPKHNSKHIRTAFKKDYVSQRNHQKNIPIIKFSDETINDILELANIDYNNFQKMITNLYNNINFEFNNCLIDLDVKVDYQYKKVDNLFSFIKGKDTTQTLVIGAHYDHVPPKKYIDNPDSIRNGADDNASGVALLLELSKYYLLNQNTPVCNIAFIYFNAEESSMLGSKYFIKNKPSKFNNIKAMINLDMVGRMKNDFLYIGYTDSSDDWMKIINKIVTNRIHIQKLHSDNRCDNSSFCDAEIPNILFTTGIHEDLHKPTDECHKINFSSMNEIFEIIKHTIDETAKYDLLEYNKDF